MDNNQSIQTVPESMSAAQLEVIIKTVCDAVQSKHTKRAYAHALREFIDWYQLTGAHTLNKAIVQAYLSERRAEGIGVGAYNQSRSAIMRLVREAVDNQAISEQIAHGIERIESLKREGVRMGNWLTIEQTESLLRSPDISTLKGLRDRAILAVLIGTGIRREELSNLTFEHIQQREGRWVIVDMIGKRDKVRSVPIPSWTKACIDAWSQSANLSSGLIFRAINKGDHVSGVSITAQAIYYLVIDYSKSALDFAVQPHDLRRTFAHLARSGGAQIEQISLALGHASIKTTELYLGTQLDLLDAACDKLGVHINGFDK